MDAPDAIVGFKESDILLQAEQLESSPSRKDNVPAQVERRHRAFGCELIQEAGILLELPQVVMVTAQNMLHRFYYRQSLKKYDALSVAMGCILLSSKTEEKPKMVRDIVFVFYFIYHLRRRTPEPRQLDMGGPVFNSWRNEVVNMERCILRDLGFCLYRAADHPHKYILYYVKILEGSVELAQCAWSFLNDSMRLDLCLRYPARTVACSAIYLSARKLHFPLPPSHDLPGQLPWHALMQTTLADMLAVGNEIMGLYKEERMEWVRPLVECEYLKDA